MSIQIKGLDNVIKSLEILKKEFKVIHGKELADNEIDKTISNIMKKAFRN